MSSTTPIEKGFQMQRIFARARGDEGSSTVEYAIIVVVAAALAGLLLKAVTSPQVYDKLFNLVLRSIA